MAAVLHPPNKLPAASRVAAGCYIDFEGFAANEHSASPPPVLVGLYRKNEEGTFQFQQVVFTKEYRWAAEAAGVEHEVLYCPDRLGFMKDLCDSLRGSKPLFAYSEYELRVIERQVGHRITKRYRNVRSIARRWLNQPDRGYPKPADNSLRSVAQVMGIPLEKKLERGGVTARLRAVREYSASRIRWESAPQKVKRQWREILMHNHWDVLATYQVMVHMRPIDHVADQ